MLLRSQGQIIAFAPHFCPRGKSSRTDDRLRALFLSERQELKDRLSPSRRIFVRETIENPFSTVHIVELEALNSYGKVVHKKI